LRALIEGGSHRRIGHRGRRNTSDTADTSNRCRLVTSLTLKIEIAGNSGSLSISRGTQAEIDVRSADIGSKTASEISLIGIHRSSHRLFSSGRFNFSLSFHFSVFDVNTIFVDVSLLMVGS